MSKMHKCYTQREESLDIRATLKNLAFPNIVCTQGEGFKGKDKMIDGKYGKDRASILEA